MLNHLSGAKPPPVRGSSREVGTPTGISVTKPWHSSVHAAPTEGQGLPAGPPFRKAGALSPELVELWESSRDWGSGSFQPSSDPLVKADPEG